MVCDRCGKEKDDVIVVTDPYIKNMSGEEVKVKLCDDCYTDKVMSI